MKSKNCICCQSPKANLECGICKNLVCKTCAQFLDENKFSYLPKIPKLLAHNAYCIQCYDEQIASQVENYDEVMERAKSIFVFYKTQSKETRLMSRKETQVKVENCPDREETLMRLAFLAAFAGFNTIIDVQIDSEKVRNSSSYQTSNWTGSAKPTNIDASKQDKWKNKQ